VSQQFEPANKLEEDLLVSGRFDPANGPGVYLHAETIVGDMTASVEEIESALQRFVAAGLVKAEPLRGVSGLGYQPLPRGHEVREDFLRARGLRHPALVQQRAHAIADLVIALANCPHIWNLRMTGPFLGADPRMSLRELELYLREFTPDQVQQVCSDLVKGELLAPSAKTGSKEPAFEITGRGRQEYRAVAGRLKIAEGKSILDIQVKSSVELFFAWQSEYKPSRNAIGSALDDVVAALNGQSSLTLPLRVVQATEAGEGAIRIDVALQEKIARADFFVGDLTPVYAYGERLRVNENVLVEVGYALASKEPNQIVLVAMKRDDVPGDATKAKPTFDIAHVRRHDFVGKDDLRRRLRTELEAALRARGWLR